MKYYYYYFKKQYKFYEFWAKTKIKISKENYYPMEMIINETTYNKFSIYSYSQEPKFRHPKDWKEITKKEYYKIRTIAII